MLLYKESSYKKYYVKEDGSIISITKGTGKEKNIKLQKNNKGYLVITINGVKELVHRVVAKTYIPCNDTSLTVNHIDGNKENNSVKNLEWCSNNDNMRHARENGLFSVNAMRKLTKKQVLYIRDKRKNENTPYRELAKEFNVANSVIGEIVRGQTYKEYV